MVQTVLLLLSRGHRSVQTWHKSAEEATSSALTSGAVAAGRPAFWFITCIHLWRAGIVSNLRGVPETKRQKKKKKVKFTFLLSASSNRCNKTTTVKKKKKGKSARQLSLLEALSNKVQINALIKWAAQSYKSLRAGRRAGHAHGCAVSWNALCGCNIYCRVTMPRSQMQPHSPPPSPSPGWIYSGGWDDKVIPCFLKIIWSLYCHHAGFLTGAKCCWNGANVCEQHSFISTISLPGKQTRGVYLKEPPFDAFIMRRSGAMWDLCNQIVSDSLSTP